MIIQNPKSLDGEMLLQERNRLSAVERDDYDDELHQPQKFRNPKTLKRAGTFWIVTWFWFLFGVISISGKSFVEDNESPTQLGYLFGHLLIAILFLVGSYFVREGKGVLLPFVTIGSIIAGIFWGGFGALVGLLMIVGIMTTPPLAVQITGAMIMGFALGFLSLGIVATFFSLRYAIVKREAVPSLIELENPAKSPIK